MSIDYRNWTTMTDDLQGLLRSMISESQRTLTFITTYKCTAACADCCFECSPDLESGKLTFDFMKRVIDEALVALPSLKVVVFSGGECYMLKDHLYRTIAYATGHGLSTRTVTNGYWGKTVATAERIADAVKAAGLFEVNISTGLDHQQWVAFDAVANAADALIRRGIQTVITIEKDTDDSNCWAVAHAHPKIQALLEARPCLLKLICNSWMPFKDDSRLRAASAVKQEEKGCSQLFSNLVVTPHQVVSACCGLTFEHIPEMRMGKYGVVPLQSYVDDIAADFLKLWIHVDGPTEIARKLLGGAAHQKIEESVHICQACAILHQDEELRAQLQARYHEFMPDVLQRYLVANLADRVSPLPLVTKEFQEAVVVE